jgi:hypothetical protein
MAKKKERFRMPDGTMTTDVKRYCKAYHDLAKPICAATGAVVHAFDPSIQFNVGGKESFGRVVDLPVSFIIKLNKALKKGDNV